MIPESKVTDELFQEVVGSRHKTIAVDWGSIASLCGSILVPCLLLCLGYTVVYCISQEAVRMRATAADKRLEAMRYYKDKDFTPLSISRYYEECFVAIRRDDTGLQEVVSGMPVGIFKLGKHELLCP